MWWVLSIVVVVTLSVGAAWYARHVAHIDLRMHIGVHAAWEYLQRWPPWFWKKEDREGVARRVLMARLWEGSPFSDVETYAPMVRYLGGVPTDHEFYQASLRAEAQSLIARSLFVAAVEVAYRLDKGHGDEALRQCHKGYIENRTGYTANSRSMSQLLALYPLQDRTDLAELVNEAARSVPFGVATFVIEQPVGAPFLNTALQSAFPRFGLGDRVRYLKMLSPAQVDEVRPLVEGAFEECLSAGHLSFAAMLAGALGAEAIVRVRTAALETLIDPHLSQ